jgi:hypothetical protein
MKAKKTDELVTRLFIQKWKKGGNAESAFLLTPQECTRKYRKSVLMDIVSALCATIAITLIIAFLLNQFVLKGTLLVSVGFGIGSVLMAVLFKFYKPAKLGELTKRMHYDWSEVSKGLHRHGLLYHLDSVDEASFATLLEVRFNTLVTDIYTAGRKEDEVTKAKLKAQLSNLHSLCLKLNLRIPEYKNLYTYQATVMWEIHPLPPIITLTHRM